MSQLYLLQFVCCVVTALYALMLVISRFQMRWLNKRYETSRWLLCFSMAMLFISIGVNGTLPLGGYIYAILELFLVGILYSFSVNIVEMRRHRKLMEADSGADLLPYGRYPDGSFRTWLSDVRFQEAQRKLLENPYYSNDTISAECGFSSHAHLYKIFKAKTGMTPGQWRNSVKEEFLGNQFLTKPVIMEQLYAAVIQQLTQKVEAGV